MERSWEQPSSTPTEAELLRLVEGLTTGPDALPLVLFPCEGTGTKRTTVYVGAANVAWACLPIDAAKQAVVSALAALRRSLVRRAEGVQAVANAEASSARLAPLTRIVLALALEDGLASNIVRGWEGGGEAVHDGIASLGAAVGLAVGGRGALEGTGPAAVVQTESHVVRHIDVVAPYTGHANEDAATQDAPTRRLHLRVEDALRYLELPGGSYTPNAALMERRWSFVAVVPSGSAVGWAAPKSDTEIRGGFGANAVVVPGPG